MKLKDYQLEGVKFLRNNRKCILSDETGLGKTLQGLQTVKENGGQTLLIAPKKLCSEWVSRAAQHGLKTAELYKDQDPEGADLVLINFASIAKYEKVIAQSKFKSFLIDEAHYLQNRGSSRTKAVKRVTKAAHNIWMLTATPVWNKLDAIWSLLNILDRKKFGSYWRFVNNFCIVIKTPFGTEVRGTRPDKLKEAQELLKNYVLVRRKEDVLELPEKLETVVWLTAPKELKKENVKLRRTIKDETGFANKARASIHLLDRNQFAFEPGENLYPLDLHIEPSKKGELLNIISKHSGSKVLVVTRYIESSQVVHSWLKDTDVIGTPITGLVPIEEREACIKEFEAAKGSCALVGTCKTLGTGLNLQFANVLVFVEHPDLYAEYLQTIGRISRIGTKDKQYIYHLVQKGTLDERTYNNCMSKGTIFNEIMGAL